MQAGARGGSAAWRYMVAIARLVDMVATVPMDKASVPMPMAVQT